MNIYQIDFTCDIDPPDSVDIISNSEEEAVEKFHVEHENCEITLVTYQGPVTDED